MLSKGCIQGFKRDLGIGEDRGSFLFGARLEGLMMNVDESKRAKIGESELA